MKKRKIYRFIMLRRAIVTSVHNDHIVVTIPKDCDTPDCKQCGVCNAENKNVKTLKISVKICEVLSLRRENSKNFCPGDILNIDVHFPSQALVALVLFGLPLLGAIFGALIGNIFFSEKQSLEIILSVIGLCTGFIFVIPAEHLIPGFKIKAKIIE